MFKTSWYGNVCFLIAKIKSENLTNLFEVVPKFKVLTGVSFHHVTDALVARQMHRDSGSVVHKRIVEKVASKQKCTILIHLKFHLFITICKNASNPLSVHVTLLHLCRGYAVTYNSSLK